MGGALAALTHAQIRRRKVLLPPADRLVDYLEDFAALYKLRIAYGQRVEMVRREEGGSRLRLETGAGTRTKTTISEPDRKPLAG